MLVLTLISILFVVAKTFALLRSSGNTESRSLSFCILCYRPRKVWLPIIDCAASRLYRLQNVIVLLLILKGLENLEYLDPNVVDQCSFFEQCRKKISLTRLLIPYSIPVLINLSKRTSCSTASNERMIIPHFLHPLCTS